MADKHVQQNDQTMAYPEVEERDPRRYKQGMIPLRIVTLARSVSGGIVLHLSGLRGDHAYSSLRTAA
jgi:hypothetical protein